MRAWGCIMLHELAARQTGDSSTKEEEGGKRWVDGVFEQPGPEIKFIIEGITNMYIGEYYREH